MESIWSTRLPNFPTCLPFACQSWLIPFPPGASITVPSVQNSPTFITWQNEQHNLKKERIHNFYNLTKCAARPGGRGKQTDVGLSERRWETWSEHRTVRVQREQEESRTGENIFTIQVKFKKYLLSSDRAMRAWKSSLGRTTCLCTTSRATRRSTPPTRRTTPSSRRSWSSTSRRGPRNVSRGTGEIYQSWKLNFFLF